jgi:predicted GIY-YIG superfamily endonuclease
MYVEEFGDIMEAISREKQIKGWSRQKKPFAKLRALIAGDFEKLIELSKTKSNPSTSFDKLRMTLSW